MLKAIKLISLVCIFLILLAIVLLDLFYSYNIVKVLMVELTPNYRFAQIVKNFKTTETEHITWYYPSEVEPTVEDKNNMEQAYMDACDFWNIEPDDKVRFVWLPGESKYDQTRIAKALGEKLQGRSIFDEGILYSIFSYTPHEINHTVAGLVNNTTALLSEGFANYLNKVNWNSNIQQVMLKAKREGEIIPLENLLVNKDFKSQDSSIAYAEAALFAKYLIEVKGPDKFRKLYEEVNFNDSKEQVIKKIEGIYNTSYSEFTTDWDKYLNNIL